MHRWEDREREERRGEGGVHGHKVYVGMAVSLQPAHLIQEYRLLLGYAPRVARSNSWIKAVIVNRMQHVSSIYRQTTAKAYMSMQGLTNILKTTVLSLRTCNATAWIEGVPFGPARAKKNTGRGWHPIEECGNWFKVNLTLCVKTKNRMDFLNDI